MRKRPAERAKEVGMGEDNGIGCYRRFLAGDKEGLEELVALYQRALIAFIDGYVRDKALAEDVEIDVFSSCISGKSPSTKGAPPLRHIFSRSRATRRSTPSNSGPAGGMPAESRGSKGREGGRGECAFRKGAGGVGT